MNKGMVDVMKIAGFILAIALIGMYILGCDLAPKQKTSKSDVVRTFYDRDGYPALEAYRDEPSKITCYKTYSSSISCIRD